MDWQGFNNAIISFKFYVDAKVEVVSRRTYKIVDVFGTVGGFMSTIVIIGLVFVSQFQ